MRGLLLVVAKDLRLLGRDRAGLVFLAIAPIVVITVAGLSLSTLFGADPSGLDAYVLPVVDEDGSALSEALVERLAAAPSLRVERVASRAQARRAVRDDKRAGAALVIPPGTGAALRAGRGAELVLYTDPVKYLERMHVLLALGAAREELASTAAAEARRAAAEAREALRADLGRVGEALAAQRAALAAAREAADAERARAQAALEDALAAERARFRERLARRLAAARDEAAASLEAQLGALRAPLARWLDALAEARAGFADWLVELRDRAGARAERIPPPPALPEPPPELARFARDGVRLELPALEPPALPAAPRIALPALPEAPALALPPLALPELPPAPGVLAVREEGISGARATINSFDQNVPGFSVTFLLLGMLLGVSLGLLDERDWGTFERLRALPIGFANMVTGKLLARFLVGVAQMIVLFAVGRVAFGVALGPQPWALLLPIVGIAFAGAAFGLLIAALVPSRDAVLPVGSAVAITMAAVGGCWWPIDLEPLWMRQAALALPTRWAMEAFNDLMMRQRTVSATLLPTAVMLAYGALYLALGVALFRRRLARPRPARS